MIKDDYIKEIKEGFIKDFDMKLLIIKYKKYTTSSLRLSPKQILPKIKRS